MAKAEIPASDSALEQAHALLVAAINAQAPGDEAPYLARLVLLLLHELQFSELALTLIEVPKQRA